jgi:hypothetical protein
MTKPSYSLKGSPVLPLAQGLATLGLMFPGLAGKGCVHKTQSGMPSYWLRDQMNYLSLARFHASCVSSGASSVAR